MSRIRSLFVLLYLVSAALLALSAAAQTDSPTPTPTPTVTGTRSPTPTRTPLFPNTSLPVSITPTDKPTSTPRPPTATLRPSNTYTASPTPSDTATPTPTPSLTFTASATFTASHTPPSPTLTPTFTATLTPTATFTPSLTLTPSRTFTPTATSLPIFQVRPGTIEGNINNAFPLARYRFDAAAGDSVTIRMETTSGDLDPFLTLYAPDGTQIGRNDDEAPGSRSAQIALTLPQTGSYVIEATRFTPESGAGELTAGTFRLALALSGAAIEQTAADPLSGGPSFAVPFTLINDQTVTAGQISAEQPQMYFAISGRQGDLIRAIMTTTDGDLLPSLRLLNDASEPISREVQTGAGETIGFVTLPEAGWYLIEASGTGTGSFDLFVSRLTATPLDVGASVSGTFEPASPSASYLINGRIGDQISVNMFASEADSGVQPSLTLRDLSGRELGAADGERFATMRATLPRSGLYILEAYNANPSARGDFNLRFGSTPLDITRLTVQPILYNQDYQGAVSGDIPATYYRFSGKTGDLVTISMNNASGDLDPYLILMDSDLNELTANDDASARRDAQITQFRLPKDGDYLIMASRSDLDGGTTTGDYTLSLLAGELSLETGAVTVTLRWSGSADLNLFVRDPNGETISYSRPTANSGGTLQIDSNTDCQTPSAQPVEHIYFPPPLLAGDYEIWVWYQDGCGGVAPVPFTLTVTVEGNDAPIIDVSETLQPGERYETAIRVTARGDSGVIEPGTITNPTVQQEASEGGDIFISYGESLTDTITNERYAVFYQFSGAAGDQIEIRVERLTGDLDPLVLLQDVFNNTLPGGVNDDASADTRDALLVYTLPYAGEYVIAVTRFGVRDGTTAGDFRITLTQTAP